MTRSSKWQNTCQPISIAQLLTALWLSLALLGGAPAPDPRAYLKNEPKLLKALDDWYQSRWLLTNGRLASNPSFSSGPPLPKATLKLLPHLFEIADSFPLQGDLIVELMEYGEGLWSMLPTPVGSKGPVILRMPTFLRGYISGDSEKSKTYEVLRETGLKNPRYQLHKAHLVISRHPLVSPIPIVYNDQVFIPRVQVEVHKRPLDRDFYFGDAKTIGGSLRLKVSQWSVTPNAPTLIASALRKLGMK